MNGRTKPTLKGAKVILRDAQDSDVDARLALGNTPAIQHMYGADPKAVRDITRQGAESWVDSQRDDPLAWVIAADKTLLGAVRLHSVNYADQRANIAIGLLDEATLGQGYGTDAIRTLAAHAFDTIGLHRLAVRVLVFNARAIAAYAKVGFVEEGRERESARIADLRHDDIIMGLLSTEFAR